MISLGKSNSSIMHSGMAPPQGLQLSILRSIMKVSMPALAHSSAAQAPAGPPPTIATLKGLSSFCPSWYTAFRDRSLRLETTTFPGVPRELDESLPADLAVFPMRFGVAKGARARTAPGAAAALVPAAMVVPEIVFILCVVEVVGGGRGIRLRVEPP